MEWEKKWVYCVCWLTKLAYTSAERIPPHSGSTLCQFLWIQISKLSVWILCAQNLKGCAPNDGVILVTSCRSKCERWSSPLYTMKIQCFYTKYLQFNHTKYNINIKLRNQYKCNTDLEKGVQVLDTFYRLI